jgi:hypothetical protein
MSMTFHPEWTELLESLLSHRVRFLIVGAHALAIIGRPSATRDLAILLEPTSANAKRFGAAVAEYGYKELAKVWRKFAVPDRMTTIGLEPLAVDIMTSISGVSFAQAWKGRSVGKLGQLKVSFLGRREFIINKRASGRPKDLLDVALLDELEE